MEEIGAVSEHPFVFGVVFAAVAESGASSFWANFRPISGMALKAVSLLLFLQDLRLQFFKNDKIMMK